MADYSHLNPEQLEAVTFGDGPLLIIAGAGTGKTTVVTKRIEYLIIEKKINPENILALTFTEKASQEMEERVDTALPYGYSSLWIETFHAFCDRVLRDEAIQIGLDPKYSLMTETESILFLKKHLFTLNLSYFRPLGNPTKFISALLQHFSRLKDEDITPEAYMTFAEKRIKDSDGSAEVEEENKKIFEIANAYKMYEALKIKESKMDFGDLIANVIRLFRERKHILKQYQEKFQYILIDEFQDTNFAQNQLATLLAGKQQNITVVGDDDQAIYRWRGAAVSNMINFREHFPSVKIVTLTKNYRSSALILDSAYNMIQNNNPDRLEVKEHISKKLEAMRESTETVIETLLSDREEQEAESVAKKIQSLCKKKKIEFKDIAILVRANDHAQSFMRALEAENIPFQFLGPGQLFHQEEIKNLIAYIKALSSFDDSASFYRVLHMNIFRLQATEIAVLLNFTKKKNISLFETLEFLDELSLSQQTREKLVKINEMVRNHMAMIASATAGTILLQFMHDSGLFDYYSKSNNEQDRLRITNIASFFDKLKKYEATHDDASVFAVTDWIELSMQTGDSPLSIDDDGPHANAVNILTIHASKGLEFPIVFIVNMVTQRFPSTSRRDQIPLPENLIKEILPEGDYHLQEERRLFYVAMTRAKDKLFFTASSFYGEGKRERKLSPFVVEAVGTDGLDKAKLFKASASGQLSLLDLFPKPEIPQIVTEEKRFAAITYLSYSQMQTFDICPLHYKLRYIMKVPTAQTAAQVYGTSIHAVLRDYYQKFARSEVVSIDDIPSMLKTNWINEGYTSKEHEKAAFEKAIEVIRNYLIANFNPKIPAIAVELPFQFFASTGLRVGGRIDRIDQLPDGSIEIIDYKTGVNVPSEKDLLDNFQLSVYALASNEMRDPFLHRAPDQIKLSLHYVEAEKMLTTTRTLDQLIIAKEKITAKAKEISDSDYPCSGSMLCQNCEFKILCNTH